MKKMSKCFACFFFFAAGLCYGQVNNPNQFKKHILTSDFISEGVAVGDVNRDGKLDILAGSCWFEAPGWKRHDIAPFKNYNPGKDYSTSFLDCCMDVNLDGWLDLVVIGFPGTEAMWYENPKGKEGYWKSHLVIKGVGIGDESPRYVDVNGDGRIDILCADIATKQMVWLSPPLAKGDTTWTRYPISAANIPGTDRFSHGLGFGDVNKDGRSDVIIKSGWWEAPVDRRQPNWVFHAADLGDDCSEMYVLDVNGDGLNDVISASAHKYGIWWHEQVKDAAGNVSWIQHDINKLFSESHGVALTDINNDGYPDIITGKRWFAHNDTATDPGAHEPAVLYWFEFTPGKAPYFIPHQIDDDSGVGLHIVVQDINQDKRKDIVVANKKGVFWFENIINNNR